MKKLEGKVAVVTGASKGIGAGIAKRLATDGASVVVNYASDKEGAEKTVAEITKAGGKAVAVKANVAKKAEVQQLFAEAKKAFGKIDIVVNNAGIFEFKPLEEIDEDHFHRHFNLNVLGLILATQEGVKHFGPEGGSVVNISSIVAFLAPPGAAVYSGTKGAVDTITRSFAKELGAKKIRVNGVAPGLVETEGTKTAGVGNPEHEMRKEYEGRAPLGRIGQPKDIASAVAFLASDDAAWVTGETLTVSGGYR